MSSPRIAFLSPVPEYEEDWSHIKADYIRLFGADTRFIDWTQAGDLTDYDLVTPLLAWGYQRDCPRWFALLDRLEQDGINVSNPARIVRWNSDKAYLAELADAGIATVPTRLALSLDDADLEEARSNIRRVGSCYQATDIGWRRRDIPARTGRSHPGIGARAAHDDPALSFENRRRR